jgi:hypothetical protein
MYVTTYDYYYSDIAIVVPYYICPSNRAGVQLQWLVDRDAPDSTKVFSEIGFIGQVTMRGPIPKVK